MSGTILIADAVATSRITLKARLASACHDTALARDVEEAARVVAGGGVDVVVASDSLPGGGIAGLRDRVAVPILAICAPEGRLAAIRDGASAVLERPLDEFMVLARLRSLRTGAADWPVEATAARAPGLAEAPAAWEPAAVSPARLALVPPDPATGMAWKRALARHGGFTAETLTAEQALAAAAAGRAADLYLIAADLAQPGDGLRLLSELRARPGSGAAGFVIALGPGQQSLAPVALDLGAGDVLPMALGERMAEEAVLRLAGLLNGKRAADRRRDAAERERRLARTDPLTGLANRRDAMPRLDALCADAGTGRAVMLVDLDRFKAVNDGFGHAAGDAVLVEVARRLQATCPADALTARLGGEEFLVAAHLPGPAAAAALAEALRGAIAASPVALPARVGGGAIRVTGSVGLAFAARGGAPTTAEAMLHGADCALLDAKAAGRNRVRCGRHDCAA
ncbi:diguanylate cyclase [Paracoccus sp. S-4012]|uniref:GGDEF domain-containing protein n=1 Tax=Paracoccus sp. S-4012 TaxID=2665648 RepID=UPI0012B0E24B|nr:diguanylate cyclase [Paracoccus sp. S-4012]MRX51266.1 diguanylate cyclase [Paracoccus sp. S-4012]